MAGESEGKDQRGIYPTSANFSTDLHSLGQFIQEGTRNLFETVVRVEKPRKNVIIPELEEDLDGLGYLQGKDVDFVNKKATDGVLLAHTDGDVPNMFITLPEQDAFTLGYIIYFFEIAIALSGYLKCYQPIRPTRCRSIQEKICSPFLVNQDLKNLEQNLTLACNSQIRSALAGLFYPFVG